MPELKVEDDLNNNNNDCELDLTTTSISDLLTSRKNVSTAPSSPSDSSISLSNDFPGSSLKESHGLTVSDSSAIPHQNLSVSPQSPTDFIVDNLEKSDPSDNKIVNKKRRVLINDKSLDKKYEDALDSDDIQRQVRASVGSLPADVGFPQSITLTRKRSWVFSKIPGFDMLKKPEEPATRTLKFFDIYKFADKFDIILMILGTIAALGVGACQPVMFYLYRQVLNKFITYNNYHTNTTINITNPCFSYGNNTNITTSSQAMKTIINYYVILGFINMFLCWIAWTCWVISAERQIRRIRFTLFRNILRQEIGWFDVHNAGELSSRLIVDLDRIKDGMSEKVPEFFSLVARMLGCLLYAFAIGWKLTLVYLAVSPLIILIFNLTLKTIVKYTMEEVQAFASASAVAQEVLQSIRTVTAFHGQKKEEERFAKNLTKSKTIGIKKGFYLGLCQGLSSIINYSAFAIIAWYGPYLARTECSNYSAGSVLIIFFASAISTTCMAQFVPNLQNFAEAAGSGIHVFDIIERQSKIDASRDEGDKPQTVTGDIEFRNVIFTYPARQEAPVLNNLSLQIPSGKTVALVGSSGCGKSTTIQLIQRFYDPDEGQIFLDGNDIRTLNVAWLRSHIGIVSQEPVLFTGSIEDNIRLGKPNATDQEIRNAAKMANAHEFIMALPDNYKTTSGDKLSGGQKQRVAIARAMISNPKILLLDEATSALDNTSERVVQDALDKAKEGRTTIVIAHRLSTIRNADIIIGLDRGNVVEHGSHDELMEKKGLYYELVTSQTQIEREKEQDSDSEEEENKEKNDKLTMPRVSVDRKFSRISIFSMTNSEENDQNGDDASLNDFSNDRKRFRTPFLFKIFKYNLPEWRWILLGTILSLVFGAVSPIYGIVFAGLYSTFGEPDVHEQERSTRIYAVVGFCIGLGGGIAQFLISVSFAKSGEALTMRMRKTAFGGLLQQEIGYFDRETNSTGALVTRLSSDASALKGLTGIRIGIILQGISTGIIGLILAFIASWKLSFVVLCFSPVLLFSSKMRTRKLATHGQGKAKNSFVEEGGQHATQAIEKIRTVVALHQEQHFIDLYEHAFNQEYKKQRNYANLIGLSYALTNASPYFLQCACFGYGNKLIEDGEITLSQMYRVFNVVSLTIFNIGRCMGMIPDYSKAKAAALRIMKLHKRQSKIDPDDDSGIILDNFVGNIEFRDVIFKYPSRSAVRILRHFSLKCSPSQTTALVGPSGSGKSTIIALLQRFYDPLKGKILLDGHDIRVLNLQWLRSLMGLVQQEPVLFNLSIRDNIAYGDNTKEITQDQIETAAKMANIHDLTISLPQGYDTLCGAKGSQLSGGQKQRIAIARALIRNPKLLLLDEATSALDNKSEKVVQQALDEARTGRTCLTIAHRLPTIRNSEKIVVVNRGKMTEEGTHEQLLKLNGIYAKLTLAQQRSGHN